MIYSKWLFEWLDNYIKPTTKYRTYNRYLEIIEKHIIPQLGEFDLEELTPIILQKFVTFLMQKGNKNTGKGLAANSVNAIINILQSSLKIAFNVGYMTKNPVESIKRPKMQEKKISCFSLQEQKQIEQAVLNSKKEKMFGVLLCLYTGLRIGELLALKWENINLQKGSLSVVATCYDGKNPEGHYLRIEDQPKTEASQRMIPLPKQLLPLLKSLKHKHSSEYVVSNKGKPISVRSYQRSFDLLQVHLGIPHRGFHSLRHTFATRALECGIDVKTLSELLGHKNATITLNRYAHSMLDHKQEMMNRLGKML